ncbi:MAG: histidine kinase N-terminal 7TM domain-containing protein [Candidatus Saccharimonadales bacterium]
MHKKNETFFCFSPLVMMSTFIIEIALALYVLWKYRKTVIGRISFILLVCLALFQLAEWMVCEGALGLDQITWSRIGFVAIGLLPALGLHLVHIISGHRNSIVPTLGYLATVAFSVYFLVATHGITGAVCGGNYVIFHVAPEAIRAFTFYYYSMLAIGTGFALYWTASQPNRHIKRALRWFVAGYAVFMVPTAIVNTIDPSTIAAIPSIMCGFAIIFAFMLVFKILPAYTKSNPK